MKDSDIETILEKINSLHEKILKSKFAEKVTESEIMSLILAVQTINRQKAEIEALKETIREHAEMLTERNAQIKMLQKENEAFAPLGKMYSEIKSEAIKEFIKRFEKNIKNVQFTLGQTWEIQSALKQTKEEMVGE